MIENSFLSMICAINPQSYHSTIRLIIKLQDSDQFGGGIKVNETLKLPDCLPSPSLRGRQYGNSLCQVQGRGPGDLGSPLILRPNGGPKGRKIFLETAPPSLSKGLDDQPPPPPSCQGPGSGKGTFFSLHVTLTFSFSLPRMNVMFLRAKFPLPFPL